MPHDPWQLSLAAPLPAAVRPGRGLLLPLAGRCSHHGTGARVALAAGPGPADEADAWAMPVATGGGVLADAFWGLAALGPVTAPNEAEVRVSAHAPGGARLERIVGRLRLEPEPEPHPGPAGDAQLVAVCMATCDPQPALLAAQIASLRAQRHERWVCVICDDASSPAGLAAVRREIAGDGRFALIEGRERAGAYRTFERCLRHVPDGAGVVALCDQDDRWHPDKLGRLLAALGPGVQLAHSDVRLVDPAGRVLAPTYWTDRTRSEEDIADLLLANTVTGMASLFRRELLDAVLPLPAPLGPDAFHDHWIALIAAARGRIAWVGQPLADYVQHDANVLGHRGRRVERSTASRWERWQGSYVDLLFPRRALAATLLLRCGADLDARRRRDLARIAAPTPAHLTVAALRAPARRRRTLGHEWRMLRGELWRARAHARPGPAVALRRDLADLMAPIT